MFFRILASYFYIHACQEKRIHIFCMEAKFEVSYTNEAVVDWLLFFIEFR